MSALYNLVNVPSAVWIDEQGRVRRIDEGTYATTHKMGEFEFGRDDYAPMVADWVAKGEASAYMTPVGSLRIAAKTQAHARAEPTFKLGLYFNELGQTAKADKYWQQAQALNPESWNYHRQDWAYTPEEASKNWQRKAQGLGEKPYYKPIQGLDTKAGGED